MVAKINCGKNMRGILNYNENKVQQGQAKCIEENMFGRSVENLSFNAKWSRFLDYMERNRRATTNAVHISLNFHPDETLTQDALINIAATYMSKIGFGEQPYLVYKHVDAGHPHLHIITTNINKQGKRIILYNIGKEKSEKARKEIENEFSLVRASGRLPKRDLAQPIKVERAHYGKMETKRTIANIVTEVTRTYRYTSLPELNAVLNQFNVMANMGSEKSQMRAKGGLIYCLLDNNGKPIGVPVKASAIYGKPTLKYLARQFKLNAALRAPHREQIRNLVEESIARDPKHWQQYLLRSGIHTVMRKSPEGRVYGITFIDHKSRSVFNGSDLGKAYSAKGILDRVKPDAKSGGGTLESSLPSIAGSTIAAEWSQLVVDLTHAEDKDLTSPDVTLRRKRKKRKLLKRP